MCELSHSSQIVIVVSQPCRTENSNATADELTFAGLDAANSGAVSVGAAIANRRGDRGRRGLASRSAYLGERRARWDAGRACGPVPVGCCARHADCIAMFTRRGPRYYRKFNVMPRTLLLYYYHTSRLVVVRTDIMGCGCLFARTDILGPRPAVRRREGPLGAT